MFVTSKIGLSLLKTSMALLDSHSTSRLAQFTSRLKERLTSVVALRVMLFCLAIKCLFVFSAYTLPPSRAPVQSHTNYSIEPVQLKTILIWNSAYKIEISAFGAGHEAFINASCPVSDCVIYTNRSALPLDEHDAIVFHISELFMTQRPDYQRRPNQRFVFLSQESAEYTAIEPANFAGYFNWTMTYRHNSDILLLYGRIKQKPSAPKTHAELQELVNRMHNLSRTNYATGKSNLAAWMVSHCGTHGKRENYIKELGKSVKIDVYGSCGDLRCARDDKKGISEPMCYDMLESKYKFYLSFENSRCRDYVTEKFFNILEHKMVPVVFGGANYNEIAPPHSYINALDYTPDALAEYLKMLDANDTLYNEYFWWKEHYEVESGVHQMARHAFCDLCQKLHEDNQVKIYDDLMPEWHHSNVCSRVESWKTSA